MVLIDNVRDLALCRWIGAIWCDDDTDDDCDDDAMMMQLDFFRVSKYLRDSALKCTVNFLPVWPN